MKVLLIDFDGKERLKMSKNSPVNFDNLQGRRFEKLVVVSRVPPTPGKWIHPRWICRCECGNETVATSTNLKTGNTKSCGCLAEKMKSEVSFVHGDARKVNGKQAKLYIIWSHMIRRCTNRNASHFEYYGGRGIRVCDEWKSYVVFKEWALRNGYVDGLSIDRKDNDGNYESSNCRWIKLSQQSKNRRNVYKIAWDGRIQCASEWARELKLDSRTIIRRSKLSLPLV